MGRPLVTANSMLGAAETHLASTKLRVCRRQACNCLSSFPLLGRGSMCAACHYCCCSYPATLSIQGRVSFLARSSGVLGRDVSSVLRRHKYLRVGSFSSGGRVDVVSYPRGRHVCSFEVNAIIAALTSRRKCPNQRVT